MVKNAIFLPKSYLSYSALNLWYKDKDVFRKKYYEGVEPPTTRFSFFGSEVHKLLEDGHLKKIPRYEKPEYAIKVEIEGIPVYGILDSFSPRPKKLLDYKSGIRKKDGSPRWTIVEVAKLDQLPFYSLLVETKFNKVHPETKLVWLETQYAKRTGRKSVLDAGLELTGHFEVFKRIIEPWERDRMREWIVSGAEAISKDYSGWVNTR